MIHTKTITESKKQRNKKILASVERVILGNLVLLKWSPGRNGKMSTFKGHSLIDVGTNYEIRQAGTPLVNTSN